MEKLDVISALLTILLYLDIETLRQADQVCKEWYRIISEGKLWKKLFKGTLLRDSRWRVLSKRHKWQDKFVEQVDGEARTDHKFYKRLYLAIVRDTEQLEFNWRRGRYCMQTISYCDDHSKAYCLQYDEDKIVTGHRNAVIKIWDRTRLEFVKELKGHTSSVLCLQYDENIIISGGSDCTVRVWDVKTGGLMNTLHDHSRPVLHLRFRDDTLVTSSMISSVNVWNIRSPREISKQKILVGHEAAVTAVELDERYIVTASRDRTIKVWNKTTGVFVRTLTGHTGEVCSMDYHGDLVVSGGKDNTVRLWNIEIGECLRVLVEHTSFVTCVQFDSRRIVSGDSNGDIKVWDRKAALNPATPPFFLCLCTLQEGTGTVCKLQFDDVQIVHNAIDNTVVILDFLRKPLPETAESSTETCSHVNMETAESSSQTCSHVSVETAESSTAESSSQTCSHVNVETVESSTQTCSHVNVETAESSSQTCSHVSV